MLVRLKTLRWNFIIKIIFSALFFVFIFLQWVPFFQKYAGIGNDLHNIFEPAARLLFSGKSPYKVQYFTNPPWLLLFYLPFSFVPAPFDILFFFVTGIVGFSLVLYRLGAKPVTIAMFFICPQFLWSLIYGNCDWIATIGFILPPQVGLFFILLKPQLGLLLTCYWLFDSWNNGGFPELIRVFSPVILGFILTFVFFPDFLSSIFSYAHPYKGNLAYFPYLIPLAVVMFYRSIRYRKKGMAIAAGPFLSPYLGVNSLFVPALGLLPSQAETILAMISLDIVWILRGTI